MIIKCINQILAELSEVIDMLALMPAANHLFLVSDDKMGKKLDKEHTLAYVHAVVKLLFLSSHISQEI